MLTPDGKPAGATDRIMLLALWTKHLQEEMKKGIGIHRPFIISAGMGKPTFPINEYAAKSAMAYWSSLWSRAHEARHLLMGSPGKSQTSLTRQEVANLQASADYGNPRGDLEVRRKIANALTRWYENKVAIQPQHILFTVGSAAALYVIFEVINKRNPSGRIITPFPYYTLYGAQGRQSRLHPVKVMKEQGYRLTAKAIKQSIKKAFDAAESDGPGISAILLCDPNNPLGTLIEENELYQIADILRQLPDIPIILDEACAEMRLDGKKHVSLLQVAPDLKDRIILMRSATKALSSAGERMAVAVAFDEAIMAQLLEANININGHAPRSLQIAFAEAVDKLDDVELSQLTEFYKPQVNYVVSRLAQMGAAMPDPAYDPQGAFYVLADLKDLKGLPLSADTQKALGKTGKILSDEDITYSLLFDDGVMIAPLSYFGLDKRLGYMRITCSGGESELEVLMNRLEHRLLEARKNKHKQLEVKLYNVFRALMSIEKNLTLTERKIVAEIFQQISQILEQSSKANVNALDLKQINFKLEKILAEASRIVTLHSPEKLHQAAAKIQAAFRGHKVRKTLEVERRNIVTQWQAFIMRNFKSIHIQSLFFNLPQKEILHFLARSSDLEQSGDMSAKDKVNITNLVPKSKL